MGRNSKPKTGGKPESRGSRDQGSLDAYLERNQLQRKAIAKDGSCLFRAVAEQVFLTQFYHQKVRMQCVGYIRAHQDDFQNFVTEPFEQYLKRLARELWGGELELVVLSKLYARTIIVYMCNEQSDSVQTQLFESVEQSEPIRLAYSDGNHYDSVYSTHYMRNMGFCQGIVYRLLFEGVLGDRIPPSCKQRLGSMEEQDLTSVSRRDSHQMSQANKPLLNLVNHYSREEMKAMSSRMYHNAALQAHHNERASIEKHDRQVATRIQFQVGDKCRFKLPGGRTQDGEIIALNNSEDCHTVLVFDFNEEWEIPSKDISLKYPYSGRRNPTQQNLQNRPKSRHGNVHSDNYNRHGNHPAPPLDVPPPSTNPEVWPTPTSAHLSKTNPSESTTTAPVRLKPATTAAPPRQSIDKKTGRDEDKHRAQKTVNPPPLLPTPPLRPKQGSILPTPLKHPATKQGGVLPSLANSKGTHSQSQYSKGSASTSKNPRTPDNKTNSAVVAGKTPPQSTAVKPANQQLSDRPVKVNGGPGGSLTSEDSNYSGNSSSDESTGRDQSNSEPHVLPQARPSKSSEQHQQAIIPDQGPWQGGFGAHPTDNQQVARVPTAHSISSEPKPLVPNGFPAEQYVQRAGRESPYLTPQIPRDPSSQPEDDWPDPLPNPASSTLLAAMRSPHLHGMPSFNVQGDRKNVPPPQLAVSLGPFPTPYPLIITDSRAPHTGAGSTSISALPRNIPSSGPGLQEQPTRIFQPVIVHRSSVPGGIALTRAQHNGDPLQTVVKITAPSPNVRSPTNTTFTATSEHHKVLSREYSPEPPKPVPLVSPSPVIAKPTTASVATQTPVASPPEMADSATQIEPLSVTTYTQTQVKSYRDKAVSATVGSGSVSVQAAPEVSNSSTQTLEKFVPLVELQPPSLNEESTPADMINFGIEYAIQCLEVHLGSEESDRVDMILDKLKDFQENTLGSCLERLSPPLVPLDPSQQDFLQSFAGSREFYASQLQQLSQHSPVADKAFFNRVSSDTNPGLDRREMMQVFLQQQELIRRQQQERRGNSPTLPSPGGEDADKTDPEHQPPPAQGFPPTVPMPHPFMMPRPPFMMMPYFPFGGFPMPYHMFPPHMVPPNLMDSHSPTSVPGTPQPPPEPEAGPHDDDLPLASGVVASHQETRNGDIPLEARLVAPSAFMSPTSAHTSLVPSSEVKVQMSVPGQNQDTTTAGPMTGLNGHTSPTGPPPTPFQTKNPYDAVNVVEKSTVVEQEAPSEPTTDSQPRSLGQSEKSQNLPCRGGKQADQKPQEGKQQRPSRSAPQRQRSRQNNPRGVHSHGQERETHASRQTSQEPLPVTSSAKPGKDEPPASNTASKNSYKPGRHSYQRSKGGKGGGNQSRQQKQQPSQTTGGGGHSSQSGRSGTRGGRRQSDAPSQASSGRGSQDPTRGLSFSHSPERRNVPYTAFQPRAFHGGFPSPNHPAYEHEGEFPRPLAALNSSSERWKFTELSPGDSLERAPVRLKHDYLDWDSCQQWPVESTVAQYSETVEDPFQTFPGERWDSDIGDLNVSLTGDLTSTEYAHAGHVSCCPPAQCISESTPGERASRVGSECVAEQTFAMKLPK